MLGSRQDSPWICPCSNFLNCKLLEARRLQLRMTLSSLGSCVFLTPILAHFIFSINQIVLEHLKNTDNIRIHT